MALTLTPSQRAILEQDSSRLLIEAGAGSGKTTTLVQIICHRLGLAVPGVEPALNPPSRILALDQIAAITFTNQSAADLKRKLRAAFRAAGAAHLAADVDAARIGTIHSFCGDVLRDVALRGGLPPGRRILDEAEGALIRSECARDALLGALADGAVPGLDALAATQNVRDLVDWVARLAADADRLARIATRADGVPDSERALVALAQRALDLKRERTRRDGVLDFDDMIVGTRDALLGDSARRHVQSRVRLLLLDEAQDTDPVQREIAFLLGGVSAPDAAPTELILVGDPKQSIYRFRRADVTQWNAAAREFAEGRGAVARLSDNFRSKAAILAFVDRTIGPLLDTPLDAGRGKQPFEVKYEPLAAAAPQAAGDEAVEIITVNGKDPTTGKAVNALAIRTREAAAVAARIGTLVAGGTPHGNIAILLSSWSAVNVYEDALRNAGIPFHTLRSDGFWESREVLDCVLALQVIRDPTDNLALAGFLKSPIIGVRDDTLLAVARQKAASWRDALRTEPRERETLARAESLLTRLGALRDRIGVGDLLQHLLDETGYLAAVAAMDGGDQRVANLRKLLRLARTAHDRTLGEFLRGVADARARGSAEGAERLYRDRGDVVTITTIHSAKGLEWPVVIWADLVRELPVPKDRFLVGRDAVAIKPADATDDGDEGTGDDGNDGTGEDGSENAGASATYDALKAEIAAESQAESYRLWYVAATRARDKLILTGIPVGVKEKAAQSPARAILASLPALETDALVPYTGADGHEYHAVVTRSDQVAAPAPAAPRARETSFAVAREAVRVPSGSFRLSASQLMAFARDPAGWWTRYAQRQSEARTSRRDIGAVPARDPQRAIVTGQLTHQILERLGGDAERVEDAIDDIVGAWATDEDVAARLAATVRAEVRARVHGATSTPIWRELSAHPSAVHELPFTRLLPGGTSLSGAIDLAVRDGEGARLLDVKSSDAPAHVLGTRYALQGAVYADAIRAIAGAEPVSFAVLALPSGETANVEAERNVAGVVRDLRAWTADRSPP